MCGLAGVSGFGAVDAGAGDVDGFVLADGISPDAAGGEGAADEAELMSAEAGAGAGVDVCDDVGGAAGTRP
jgi:hypothetical protein